MNKNSPAMKARRFLTQYGLLAVLSLALPGLAEARRNMSNVSMQEFMRQNPCPATGTATPSCPGYVVDFRVPLCAGGANDIANMQWLSVDAAREKEKRDLADCRIEKRE